MKRSVAFSVIFLLGTLAALAQPAPSHRFSNPLLDDVVAMSRAGLSDATIVAYVQARRTRLDSDLNADDLIRLQRAGVSEPVVREIAGAADIAPPRGRREASNDNHDEDMTYDSSDGAEDYPAGPATVEGYDYPYYDYLYSYGYPYWYAYSPYFSSSFVFGGRRFFHGGHGGGFVHHSSGHGANHSSGHSGGHSSGHSSHSSSHSGGGHH